MRVACQLDDFAESRIQAEGLQARVRGMCQVIQAAPAAW
jgi:hypothetical protein